jgi:hypothetical protein
MKGANSAAKLNTLSALNLTRVPELDRGSKSGDSEPASHHSPEMKFST